jgi:hypothetical protein
MAYIGKSPTGTGVRSRYYYTATGGETSLSGADDNSNTLVFSDGNYVDVMLNGVTLVAGTDYNTSTANTIGGLAALSASDIVEIVVYDIFTVADTVSAKNGGTFSGNVAMNGDLTVDTNTLYVDSTNNRVGINQASPSHPIHVGTSDLILDSSGNLQLGKTASGIGTNGITLYGDGAIGAADFTRDGGRTLALNRKTSDGDIVEFRKDGTTVGSVGTNENTDLYIAGGDTGLLFNDSADFISPATATGSGRDNAVDLGYSTVRWGDVYATNGTIQTSDANEKQQIATLTDAEITAAKAISQLFKTFKWNSAVEAKGDAARTHTGVIAQDVEAAMTSAGLDAGDYAFFISSTWYVDADGNEVEADAEGAIEKNRKGIRYPELLAFVGAATEQRLANIETRLAALENV